MVALAKNTEIKAIEFKNRLKEIVNNLLPDNNNSWNRFNRPDDQMDFLLSDHDEVYGEATSLIDNTTNTIFQNLRINVNPVFNLIRDVFVIISKCKRVYWQNAQSYPGPGTQDSPITIANNTGASSGGGTLTYFKTSFSLIGNYNAPAPASNANIDVRGFKMIPDWNAYSWNNNSKRNSGTSRLNNMNINNIIKALEGVEQQMTNFRSEWNTRNNSSGWWSGNINDTSSSSSRIFFVRYWCHSNCHSNCHGSCHGSRGRR